MLHEAVSGNREAIIGGKHVTIGWGADATRFTCADAGDTLEDSNFSCDTANNIILRLTTELDFIRSIYHVRDDGFAGPNWSSDHFLDLRRTTEKDYNFHDKAFKNKINYNVDQAKIGYESMRFRDALKFGFFNLQSCRDTYRDACTKLGIPMHETLIKDFIIKQLIILSPICNHFCEYAWRAILKKEGSVTNQNWPESEPVDVPLMRVADFLEGLIQKARKTLLELQGKRVKSTKGSKGSSIKDPQQQNEAVSGKETLVVLVSEEYPRWKKILLEFTANLYDPLEKKGVPTAMKQLKQFCVDHPELKTMVKKAMQVGSFILKRSEIEFERAFEQIVPFNQRQVLEENKAYFTLAVGVEKVCFENADDNIAKEDKSIAQAAAEAEPGNPSYVFV